MADDVIEALSALRKYNEYLIAKKYQRGEVFKRGDFLALKPGKPKGMSIPDTQIGNFIARVRKNGNARDIALVTLLAHAGITLGEALALTIWDIDWKEAEVKVGDKKKERRVPLPDQSVEALQVYREIRRERYPKATCISSPVRAAGN